LKPSDTIDITSMCPIIVISIVSDDLIITFTSYNLQIMGHMDVISIVSDDLIITFTSYNLQIMGHMDVISIDPIQ
jgi:hypothetical protein